ncbi:unnamed protein product [Cladocopium goreaui]|uniref:Uncharacterized protein n=1 Tax=Cladocopium goreaui TaxID=2562237 RepID=A0A9P1C3Y0_9DINO|nr:unnamed protein product [Cladocopium goreaui]
MGRTSIFSLTRCVDAMSRIWDDMLPPLALPGSIQSSSASSWHSARNGRSNEGVKSDPGGFSFEERASRLGAIRQAERDEIEAKRKALAKQASELSKAAAALAGAYRDRWRSPRVEGDADASAIASLRKEMQDLRRECLEARAPSPTAKETMSAAETGAGSGHRPSASSGWRQPFAGKGFSRGAGTGSSLGHQYPQRVVFGRYAKHRASYIASHKVAERVRKMGAGREEPEEVQPSAGDDDWQDEDWYEDEWWDDEDGGWDEGDGWDEGW